MHDTVDHQHRISHIQVHIYNTVKYKCKTQMCTHKIIIIINYLYVRWHSKMVNGKSKQKAAKKEQLRKYMEQRLLLHRYPMNRTDLQTIIMRRSVYSHDWWQYICKKKTTFKINWREVFKINEQIIQLPQGHMNFLLFVPFAIVQTIHAH